MKRFLILLVLAILLAACGAGGLYLLGIEVERRFDAAIKRWDADERLEVSKAKYTRSFFGADARSEVRVEGVPFSARFRHEVIFPPFARGGVIQIITTLDIPADAMKQILPLFGDAPPLIATTAFHWDGSSTTEFSSPGFHTPLPIAGEVEWRGLRGTLHVKGRRMQAEIEMPGMKTSGGILDVSMEALGFDFDVTKATDGLWLGEAAFELAHLDMMEMQGKRMVFDGVRARQSMKEESSDLLRIGFSLDAGKIAMETVDVSDAGLEMELYNVDRAPVVALIKRAGSRGSLTTERAIALANGLKGEIPKLLRRSPKVTLKRAAFRLPAGGMKANGSVEFADQDGVDDDPAGLLRPKVKAHLEIGKPLFGWMVRQEMRERARLIGNAGKERTRLSDGQVESLATSMSDMRISQLERQGVLVDTEGNYVLDVTYENAEFTLNGQTEGDLGLWD